ncbi:LOW QUALITY PROTEIN: uncharacterized protein LOC144734543 [Lampetra planeri]
MNLDGRAADFVEALPASAQTQLEELMRRLDQRFGTRDEEEAKSALEARRRQPGEDLRDYAEDVRELTKIARPGYATEVIEELAAEKIQRYLSRTAWWQPDVSCPRLPFNTLVERARKCERIHSERAQLRGLGRERAIACLLSEDEEEEQELARTVRGREREPPVSRETTPGWVAGIQTGIKDVSGQVTQIDNKVNQVGERVTQVREETNKNMTKLQTSVETIRSEMGDLRATVGGLSGRVARLEAEGGQRRNGGGGSGQGAHYGAAPPPRACYMCDRRGHLVRDCPEITRARQTRGLKLQRLLVSGPTRGAIDAVPIQIDGNENNGERVIHKQVTTTTPKGAGTSGDWLRELVAGITGATSLVEGQVNGQRTRILLDTGAVASLMSAAHCSMLGVDVGCLQAPDRALHTASGAGMGLLGKVSLEVRLGNQVCTQEFYVSSVLCHECIAGTDLLEKLGLNVQPRQRCATVEGSGERIPFLGQEPNRPRFTPVAATLVSAVTIGPLAEMLVPVATLSTDPTHRPSGEVMLTPHPELASRYGVVGSATLVNADGGRLFIRVFNPHSTPAMIRRRTPIATVHPLHARHSNDSVFALWAEDPGRPEGDQDLAWRVGPTPRAEVVPLLDALHVPWADLPKGEADRLRELLREYADVFSEHDSDVGRTDLVKQQIDTGAARPIKLPAYRVGAPERAQIKEAVGDMLRDNIIQPSASPWSAPVVLVTKKDGSTRFCVDYRKLNAVTLGDAFPIPRIDDTFDSLAGARYFSTLDLASGYWQVEMTEEDRPKTAFTTPMGLFEFRVLPFGLTNAPATFQRLMELVMRGLQWEQCLIYLDDVIVFSRSLSEHWSRLREVFQRLRAAHLKLKPRKCYIAQREVGYLGHRVSEAGVSTDPEKVRAVVDWPRPRNLTEIRSFLGLATYYRRFVKGFSEIARPLTQLTSPKNPYQWSEACQTAFTILKDHLTHTPTLAFPDFTTDFILDTDACSSGLGAVLSQVQGGTERVIAYASRTLSGAELNYCVTRQELYAVIFACKQFRPYLYGRKCRVRTDHYALQFLLTFKEPRGQMARWLAQLQEYNLQIEYRAGRTHANADALSRRPAVRAETREGRIQEDVGCAFPGLDDEQLRQTQQRDPDLAAVEAALRERKDALPGPWSGLYARLCVENGVVRELADAGQPGCICVPAHVRPQLLRLVHDHPLGGHDGERRTRETLRRQYLWPKLAQDVAAWVQGCRACQQCGQKPARYQVPLRPFRVSQTNQLVGIDLQGPFPRSHRGNRYILVAVEYFTRYPRAVAIPDKTALVVARAFVENYVLKCGIPERVITDQGSEFEAELFQALCREFGIQKDRTTAYHPQANGMVERMNQTLAGKLKRMAAANQQDWDEHLPYALFAYTTAVHTSTGQTPFLMMFGRESRLPADLLFGVPPPQREEGSHPVEHLLETLRGTRGRAYPHGEAAHQRQEQSARPRMEPPFYTAGSEVWLYTPRVGAGQVGKLTTYWRGPWIVRRQISPWTVLIQGGERGREMVVNIRRLKPWRAAPEGGSPAGQVPRNPGVPPPPVPGGLAQYMGPTEPRAPRGPVRGRGRRGRRPLNPTASEFVPQPAGARGRGELLEWRRRPPPEPQETEPPPPRPATRAGRIPRTPRRYLVGATQARCSSQPGMGTGTPGGYVVPQRRGCSAEPGSRPASPTALPPITPLT